MSKLTAELKKDWKQTWTIKTDHASVTLVLSEAEGCWAVLDENRDGTVSVCETTLFWNTGRSNEDRWEMQVDGEVIETAKTLTELIRKVY